MARVPPWKGLGEAVKRAAGGGPGCGRLTAAGRTKCAGCGVWRGGGRVARAKPPFCKGERAAMKTPYKAEYPRACSRHLEGDRELPVRRKENMGL